MLFYAVSLLIPLVMALLSLTLKDSVNRWANIIGGIVFAGLYLADLIAHLADPYAYAMLMGIAAVVAQALIVWYAWKWLTQTLSFDRLHHWSSSNLETSNCLSRNISAIHMPVE